MKRYSAFDPPEYLAWTPDSDLVRSYARTLEADEARAAIVSRLAADDLLAIYRDLLRTRLHDIGLKRWVKTGVISKAWLGTGEEAVTVGTVRALDPAEDVVSPMIRNAGALHMMGMPLADMFRGYLATSDSPSAGRDLHIGDLAAGIVQPISHMGTSVTIVTGIALAFRNREERRVALTWIGDGATKTAACHEGMNLAAVQDVPAIFVIQNNQVALGTRLADHGAGDIHAWPAMYGIESWSCDGNNVLDVYAATVQAVDRCRRGEGPAAIVADTFRMGGHARRARGAGDVPGRAVRPLGQAGSDRPLRVLGDRKGRVSRRAEPDRGGGHGGDGRGGSRGARIPGPDSPTGAGALRGHLRGEHAGGAGASPVTRRARAGTNVDMTRIPCALGSCTSGALPASSLSVNDFAPESVIWCGHHRCEAEW
jgi:TPP-dependent pyruvate/acetoin dehydrogenase alpha subunit